MKNIRKYLLAMLVALVAAASVYSQEQTASKQPAMQATPAQNAFEGTFFCAEHKINIHLNLNEENLEIPNYSFLGKVGGYMDGTGVYGIWLLTSHSVKGNTATLRFSNDTGSDSQTIAFTALSDSVYHYEAVGGNCVRKAVGRKLVKIANEMTFRRK